MNEQDYAQICLGIQSCKVKQLGNYLSHGVQYKYFADEAIQLPWKDNFVFFISRGSFRLSALNADGEEYDIAYCYQDSVLVTNEVIMENSRLNPPRIVAMENSIVVSFDRDEFYRLIQTDRELFDEYVTSSSTYAALLKERLLITANTSSSLRLLNWLEKLCLTQEPDEKGIYNLPCKLTQQQIANLLFIHITTCNKVFSRLSKEKVARYFRGRIEIYDLERLRLFISEKLKLL